MVSPSYMDVNLAYGLIIMSIAFILLYVPVILSFITRADSTPSTFTYRLMTYHSLSDILQLLCHSATGILLLFKIQEHSRIYEIIGAFLSASWFMMLSLTITLSIHRFILVVFSKIDLHSVVLWTVGLLNLSIWIVIFVLNLTPYSSMYYKLDEHYWSWDLSKPCSWIFTDFDGTIMFVVCITSLLLYVVVFVYIFWKRQKTLYRSDLRIALQMFSYSFFTLFVGSVWEYGDYFIPDIPIILFLKGLLWPMWNGASAVLYLIFDRSSRRSLRTISKKMPFTARVIKVTTTKT